MDTGGAEAQIRPEKPLTAIFLARIFDQRPPRVIYSGTLKLHLGGRWSKIRAKKNFRTKNPSLFAKFGVFPPHAISAGAVFGHFLPKKGKKWPKSALSLYRAKRGPYRGTASPQRGGTPLLGAFLGKKGLRRGGFGGQKPPKPPFGGQKRPQKGGFSPM